jgi:hypothetical protein
MTDADDRALVCSRCVYDLRGLPDGACPECGRGFTRTELLAGLERGRRWSWREPVRCVWIAAAMLAGIVVLRGTTYLLFGLAGLVRGEWWSGWEDFRPGQKYDQYPLTNREAVGCGIVLLCLAAGAGLVLWRTHRRVWPRAD